MTSSVRPDTQKSQATEPRRRNAPRVPPEERRRQLLDAALRVLAADGLPQLTMEAVARQAGIAKPVLYAMYPTRVELIAALLEREHDHGIAQVTDAMPTDLIGSDPAVAYVETIKAFLTAVADNPDRWRLILDAGDSAPADFREHLARARRDIVARSISLAEIGLAIRGDRAALDAELLGHFMLGIAEWAGRLVLTDPLQFTPARITEFASTIALALPRTLPLKGNDQQ